MKIAVVHSFYSEVSPSGENFVVDEQVRLLSNLGHEVRLFFRRTDEMQNSFGFKFQSAIRVAFGFGGSPLEEIKGFNPDVTLIHNLFPNFGDNFVPLIPGKKLIFLHNFRLFCANGVFFRSGEVCFACIEKTPLQAVRNACYKESSLQTLPLVISQMRNRPYENSEATTYVALSKNSHDIFVKNGVNPNRIKVLHNFIDDFTSNSLQVERLKSRHWTAVGRITPEKGFRELVANWPDGYHLDIFGDGSDLEYIKSLASKRSNIRFRGRVDKAQLVSELPKFAGAITPSLWIENCPLSTIEYLCAGLPTITLSVNALSDIIGENTAGIVLESFNEKRLLNALNEINGNLADYSLAARNVYETYFTPEVWIKNLQPLLE